MSSVWQVPGIRLQSPPEKTPVATVPVTPGQSESLAGLGKEKQFVPIKDGATPSHRQREETLENLE